MAARRGTGA
jgi:hypothetical protein